MRVQRLLHRDDVPDHSPDLENWSTGHLISENIQCGIEKKLRVRFESGEEEDFFAGQVHIPLQQLGAVTQPRRSVSPKACRGSASTLAAHVRRDLSPPAPYTGHPSSAEDETGESSGPCTSANGSESESNADCDLHSSTTLSNPSDVHSKHVQTMQKRRHGVQFARPPASDSDCTLSGAECGSRTERMGSVEGLLRPSAEPGPVHRAAAPAVWRAIPTRAGVLRVACNDGGCADDSGRAQAEDIMQQPDPVLDGFAGQAVTAEEPPSHSEDSSSS